MLIMYVLMIVSVKVRVSISRGQVKNRSAGVTRFASWRYRWSGGWPGATRVDRDRQRSQPVYFLHIPVKVALRRSIRVEWRGDPAQRKFLSAIAIGGQKKVALGAERP